MSKEWTLEASPYDAPALDGGPGAVELGDDGSLRVDTYTYVGTITFVVPAADMAKLMAAWDERQERLKLDAVEPVSPTKGGGS